MTKHRGGIMDFLPINMDDMKKRGWEECDFVFVTGDAYVDHSSFAVSILSIHLYHCWMF